MTKHLIDIDDEALAAARAALGTTRMEHTVNRALRRASGGHLDRVGEALDRVASVELGDRADAWR